MRAVAITGSIIGFWMLGCWVEGVGGDGGESVGYGFGEREEGRYEYGSVRVVM